MARWARPESQRRKWNLEDRTSLRNLHGNLTENGDSNSQYEIARQILEDEAAEDSRADYSLGIDWLLKASYEGHEGALILLSKSLKSGRGINDRNIIEVETCLAMTQAERNARKAARELFNCLKQTNNSGEHYITVAQLEKKMREIYKLKSSRYKTNQKSSASSSSSSSSATASASGDQGISPYHSIRANIMSSPGNNISEANLISAAMEVVHGQLPHISSSLTLSVPHPESLNHIPYFHRILFHPLLFIYLIYHQYLNALARFPSSLANCLIFVMILSYTTTINNVLAFIPIVIYHVSLFVMIVSTLKMFKSKHRYDDFRIWSQLFLSFDQQFDTNAENAFLRKELQPYLMYFSAFFVHVIVSPTIPLDWRMSSEVTIISFVLLFVTLFLFMYNNRNPFPDLLILLSFGINVLVKYPFEMDAEMWSNWLMFDLKIPTFAPFAIGHGIEFCFNCRGYLYLLIPALFITLAHRQNWHGIYQCLIPHCVTLSWLQICIISSQSAVLVEMVRGTLSLAGLLFCLPLFGLLTLMIPVFVTVESLGLTNAVHRLIASVSIAGIALIVSCLLATYRRTKKYITMIQIIICLVATFYITQKYFHTTETDSSSNEMYHTIINRMDSSGGDTLTTDDEASVNYLKWEMFNRHCHVPLLYPGNRIQAQLKCDRFQGSTVKWQGSVYNVEIRHVSNVFERIVFILPDFVGNAVRCWFGEPNELMFDVYDSDELDYFKEQNQCNLNNWNTYEFRIGVKLDYSPIELYLKVHHSFNNFTRLLSRTDRIWFTGILLTSYTNPDIGNDDNAQIPSSTFNLEKHPLWIDLTSIGCIKCKETSLKAFYISNRLSLNSRNIFNGVKYLLNVLFNPLIKIN